MMQRKLELPEFKTNQIGKERAVQLFSSPSNSCENIHFNVSGIMSVG